MEIFSLVLGDTDEAAILYMLAIEAKHCPVECSNVFYLLAAALDFLINF